MVTDMKLSNVQLCTKGGISRSVLLQAVQQGNHVKDMLGGKRANRNPVPDP